jgi:biotin operon repressor
LGIDFFIGSLSLLIRIGFTLWAKRAPGVKPRDLILTALLEAGKNGLSQKLLVDKTGLSRDKVYDDCKMLEEKEGLVRHESKGRRTTYYATREIFGKDKSGIA